MSKEREVYGQQKLISWLPPNMTGLGPLLKTEDSWN